MTDAPAFDFYPERFWFAVEGWTDAEIVRYWRLLGQQWMRDGLPADLKELASLARGRLTDRLLAKFPISDDGKRRNSFLETLRAEQRKRIADRSAQRKAAVEARWARQRAKEAETGADPDTGRITDVSFSYIREGIREDTHHPPPTTHPNHLLQNSLCEPERNEAARHGARRDGEGMEELANPGLPPVTLEQAKANAGQYGASPEIAEKWWLEQDGRGWLDGRGQAIVRPWSSLRSFAIGWQGREARDAARSPAAARQSDIQRRREERHGSEKLEIEYT